MVGIRVEALTYLPAVAWAAAAATMIGQSLGAGLPDRARRAGHEAVLQCGVLGVVITAAFYFGAEPIYRAMHNSEAVIAAGVPAFRMLALFQLPLVAGIVYVGGLHGAGDTQVPMWITLFTTLFVRLPMAWVLRGRARRRAIRRVDRDVRRHAAARRAGVVRFWRGGWERARSVAQTMHPPRSCGNRPDVVRALSRAASDGLGAVRRSPRRTVSRLLWTCRSPGDGAGLTSAERRGYGRERSRGRLALWTARRRQRAPVNVFAGVQLLRELPIQFLALHNLVGDVLQRARGDFGEDGDSVRACGDQPGVLAGGKRVAEVARLDGVRREHEDRIEHRVRCGARSARNSATSRPQAASRPAAESPADSAIHCSVVWRI